VSGAHSREPQLSADPAPAMSWLDSERARRLAWLALGVYIVGLGISAALRLQGDFFVYYRAGHRVLRGLAIYPADETDRFLYAPIFAIAFAPFALLPRHVAQGLWFVFNAWGLVAFITGSVIMLFGRARRLSAPLLAIPVLLCFRFIGNNIEHGQINLPILALCTWAIVHAREDRPRLAGVMLAAAVLVKPFALLAALYLTLRRKWPALGYALVAGAAMFLVPILVLGARGLGEQTSAYLRTVASMATQYRTMLTNQSAVAAAARLMVRFGDLAGAEGSAPFRTGMAIEGILVGAVSLWTVLGGGGEETRTAGDRYAVAGFFCLMPGFAPISWKSYFAALVVPYMLLTDELRAQRRLSAPAWALLVGSVLLNFLPGRRLNRIALYYSANFFSSLMVLAAVALVALARTRNPMASVPISAQADRAV
jgi:Glycosyltransferase family 87